MSKEESGIVFEQDMELCYDGVNTKHYKKGEVYKATHAHEKRMFDAFLIDGRAKHPVKKAEVKAEKPKEKVVKPKQTKKSKKSK